jgi:drug/metabolite transporter (DMT)-like permease
MELWIPITLGAAFFQNLRSALQKHLKARLSTSGAAFSRFCYAFPFALAYLATLVGPLGLELPRPNAIFGLYCVLGGTAQILATALLVHLFSYRNFAVGTTYSKTETVQTALFGIVILGDPLSAAAAVAIGVSLCGVLAISVAKSQMTARSLVLGWTEPPALIGIASGGFFGISAVSYRAASLSLGGEGFLAQAGYTLACVTVLQTLGMGLYIRLREPGQLSAVLRAWPVAALVGLCGMIASACWFTAMTIQNAAYVRALGQVELLFTFVASTVFFRERTNAVEFAGIALVVAGILVLLLG